MSFIPTQPLTADGTDRVDGKLKVTGAAKYAAEYPVKNLAYGVLVGSTIAKGSIKSIDSKEAKNAPGVLEVITHENSIKLEGFADEAKAKQQGMGLRIFHTNEIFSNGQPIVLVVADKLEQAIYAASLVKVVYDKQEHNTNFETTLPNAKQDIALKPRGDINAWKKAPVTVEQEYYVPTEVHNPIEMHATIAVWEAEDKLTVYDKNHSVKDVQRAIANACKLPQKNVTVIAEFVGGGFGSGLRVWPHAFAAIIAAKQLKRPVKVCVTRPQMFTMVGYRPHSWQKISVGATVEGKITGLQHEAVGQTSTYENFTEDVTGISKLLYDFPNLATKYKTMPLNVGTPIWMRAPGEATGSFALECAIDELSYKLKMDPLELRRKNYPEKNPDNGLPWSSNFLRDCYDIASKQFGWEKRKPEPRATRNGDWWVGVGMGVGTWGAYRLNATVRAVIDSNGNLLLQSATSDMGPGTATTMIIIASQAMGLAKEKIKFELGRSNFPDSPAQGGSFTTATVGPAVNDACIELKKKLASIAAETGGSEFINCKYEDLVFTDGKLSLKSNTAVSFPYQQLLQKKNMNELEVVKTSAPDAESRKYTAQSFAVHFTEVHVHAYTGTVRVKRFVSCVDAGTIINEKTAASQIKGAVVGSIGMALMEDQEIDNRFGRLIANDFAGYHIPVNADVPVIDVSFVNKPDPYLNTLGTKGLGEVGLIGSTAAIANAVFHATGKRITSLPITPGKLI